MLDILIIGRLGADPELKYLGENRTPLASFNVAVSNDRKNQNGEYDSTWFRVEAWGKLAEACVNCTGKGLYIAVRGTMKEDRFDDQNGQKRSVWKLTADKIKFIEFKSNPQQQQPQQGNPQQYQQPQNYQPASPQGGYQQQGYQQVPNGYQQFQQNGYQQPQQQNANGWVPNQNPQQQPNNSPNGFDPNAGGWTPMEDMPDSDVPF